MWIELHQSLPRHPKLYRLAKELNIEPPVAFWHLCCLWLWALEYAPDGNLESLTEVEVSAGAEWRGDPNLFIESLSKCDWLDPGPVIHDWETYAGKLLARRDANKMRMREARAKHVFNTCETRAQSVCNSVQSDRTVPYRTVPNQQLSSPKSATPSAGADMKALETEFLAAWNDLPPPFSKIAEWNAKRKTAFKARIGEPYFKANWRAALDRMKASVFCRGGGPTGWVATVEFFLRPGAVAKILEGTYDGNGKRPVQKTERKLTDEDYRQQEIIIAENRKNAERDRLQRERDIAAGLIIPSQPKPNGSQAGDKVAQGREVPDLPHVRELVLGIKSVSPVG